MKVSKISILGIMGIIMILAIPTISNAISVTTTYPSVLSSSEDYKNMEVTITKGGSDTYSGVMSVTIYLATEDGNEIKQIGYQSKSTDYETNLLDGEEKFVGINTYGWELSDYEGNYTLKIVAFLIGGEAGYGDNVVVGSIPVTIKKGENGAGTPGFEMVALIVALGAVVILVKRRR